MRNISLCRFFRALYILSLNLILHRISHLYFSHYFVVPDSRRHNGHWWYPRVTRIQTKPVPPSPLDADCGLFISDHSSIHISCWLRQPSVWRNTYSYNEARYVRVHAGRSDGNSGDSGVPPAARTRPATRGAPAALAQTFIIAQQRSSWVMRCIVC